MTHRLLPNGERLTVLEAEYDSTFAAHDMNLGVTPPSGWSAVLAGPLELRAAGKRWSLAAWIRANGRSLLAHADRSLAPGRNVPRGEP